MYENGTSISSISGHTTYSTGDEFVVEYRNGYVRYYHNGVLCRTVSRSLGSLLYADTSFHNGGYIYDVHFDQLSSIMYSYESQYASKSTGMTFTGDISYQGSNSTDVMIHFLNNTSDGYGNGSSAGYSDGYGNENSDTYSDGYGNGGYGSDSNNGNY
jgi:hypothetical protein